MSTIIKLSPDGTQYYIIDRRNCENTMRYTHMYSTKGAHEFTEGKLERSADLEG